MHVKSEHHMWDYLFFFIHLDETRPNDYMALELYVYRMVCIRSTHKPHDEFLEADLYAIYTGKNKTTIIWRKAIDLASK